MTEPSENDPLERATPAIFASLGRYKILEEIARGGMGIIYKAFDPGLQRTVAIKVLRDIEEKNLARAIERFRREAEAVARLRHANIVGIHEVSTDQDLHYIVMDYIDGVPLDARFGSGLPRENAVRILEQVANAIDYAHSQGVIHRDLKPGNILVDKSGRPWVTDFGLAKIHDVETRLTQTGQAIGTPLYMSPEQVAGRRGEVDSRTDIYSLGVILYEAVTGRVPFLAPTPAEVYRMIADQEPVRPRALDGSIPTELDIIILKAMEKEPRHRYATAGALAEDLRRLQAGEPILARPSGLLTRVGKRIRRNPGITLVAALSMLAVLVAAGIAVRQAIRRGGVEKLAAREREESERRGEQEREAKARQAERQKNAVPYFQSGVNALTSAEDRYRIPGEKLSIVRADLDKAELMFSKAIETFADYAEAFHYRGRTRLMRFRTEGETAQYDLALADLDRAIRLNDRYTTAYFDRARLNIARYVATRGIPSLRHAGPVLVMGKPAPESDEARTYRERIEDDIERLGRLSPLPDEARFARVALAYAQSRHEEVISAAREALEGSAHTDEVYAMRGESHLRRIEPAEAVADFDEAVRRRPNDPRIWRLKAHARFLNSDFRGATADYEKVAELQPDAPAYVNLARAYGWQGRVDDAEEALRRAEKADAAYPDLYAVRALVHMRHGRTKEMFEDINKAIELAPKEAFFRCNRADLYQMTGKAKESLGDYQAALEMDPELWVAHVNRGSLRYSIKDFEGAAEDATEALARQPKSPDALFNRGNALLMLTRYDEAIEDYTNAMKYRPRVPEMYYYRGVAHNRKAEIKLAIDDFTQAIGFIEANPGRWNEEWKAWYSRGQDEYELKMWKECVEDLEKACAKNPALKEGLAPKIEDARKKMNP